MSLCVCASRQNLDSKYMNFTVFAIITLFAFSTNWNWHGARSNTHVHPRGDHEQRIQSDGHLSPVIFNWLKMRIMIFAEEVKLMYLESKFKVMCKTKNSPKFVEYDRSCWSLLQICPDSKKLLPYNLILVTFQNLPSIPEATEGRSLPACWCSET